MACTAYDYAMSWRDSKRLRVRLIGFVRHMWRALVSAITGHPTPNELALMAMMADHRKKLAYWAELRLDDPSWSGRGRETWTRNYNAQIE